MADEKKPAKRGPSTRDRKAEAASGKRTVKPTTAKAAQSKQQPAK